MDIYPINSLVSITRHGLHKPPRKYYGYVIKVEVTSEGIRYFVQFHPEQDAKQYTPADLTEEFDLQEED